MALYLAVPLYQDAAMLKASIEKHIALSDRFNLEGGAGWLIKFPGTVAELADLIDVAQLTPGIHPSAGSALVVLSAGYRGMGPTEMWDWLRKTGCNPDGLSDRVS
jgi:hypothetical protein